MISIFVGSEVEVGTRVISLGGTSAYRKECKPLVLQQVNCRNVYNNALEFWNLVDATIPMLL